MKSYAGIGSRKTPLELKETIQKIVIELSKKGYILRSGGADGADSFFEEFAEQKEIYLPWKDFNYNKSQLYGICNEAYKIAKKFHPQWNKLSYGVKKLIARNGYQILGKNLDDPVDFVICWTPNGKTVGGTAQAIRIAKFLEIPIFNLFNQEKEILEYINNLESPIDKSIG